jgi:hypothetical protein
MSEMGVSRYVERNSAFGVAVRPSRAAIPPGGMPPGEYRLSLGEEGVVIDLPIWYFSGPFFPVGEPSIHMVINISMGRIGRRGWDSYQRVCVTLICLQSTRTHEGIMNREKFCTVLVFVSLSS